MIRLAICDDDQHQLKYIQSLIWDKCSALAPETETFANGQELLRAIELGNYQPDIVLMDIVMPESGIEVTNKLNRICPHCSVIYISSYLGYIMDVYETRHSYFIVKEQLAERIAPAVEKALKDLKREPRLSFKEGGTVRTLLVREVLYLERRLKKTIIHHSDGRSFSVSRKPEALLAEAAEMFVRCHQSFHVNLEKISAMSGDNFQLCTGELIPISRSHKKEARESFLASLSSALKE